ncbi:MAG: hypothetical protein K1W37_12775 [Lachnospiraceae bacterium]
MLFPHRSLYSFSVLSNFTISCRMAGESGRLSVKDKLSQMKAKVEQQSKAPEPDKAAAKNKEVCL